MLPTQSLSVQGIFIPSSFLVLGHILDLAMTHSCPSPDSSPPLSPTSAKSSLCHVNPEVFVSQSPFLLHSWAILHSKL